MAILYNDAIEYKGFLNKLQNKEKRHIGVDVSKKLCL